MKKKKIKEAINEERAGVKQYTKLAKQDALHKRLYKNIAKDEKGHIKKLKKIV